MSTFLARLSIKSIVTGILLTGLAGCAAGPIDYPREYTEAVTDTEDTFLGREVAEFESNHPGKSGFYPLSRGMDALGARLTLMDQAERSIDAQYFLMKSDDAGLVFAGSMLEAANRGVRVRFLLDDIFTSVDDRSLLLLDSHPNIEVRLFNPISRSGIYYLNYAGNFKRANRRMHNKSFIVDNQIGIVGGRNIAAEYFELEHGKEFVDFDMLAVGPVAADVSITFDRFWNHEFSVPMAAFADKHSEKQLQKTRQQIATAMEEAEESIYAAAMQSRFIHDVHEDLVRLYASKATVVTDDPEKLQHKASGDFQVLVNAVTAALEVATNEVIVVTPYMIPGDGGMEMIKQLTGRGVRVVVYTNSLASTNHVAVHAGYSRYRKPMLRAGVELYEARANAGVDVSEDPENKFEALTLHTKGILIDREVIFVGSLNIDPRSVDINTEMGVLIESPELASVLGTAANDRLHEISYKVELDADENLVWSAIIEGKEVIETSEPLSSRWRRFKAFMSRILPEQQL